MRICRVNGIMFSINNWFLALLGVYFAAGVLGKGLTAFAVVFAHELAHVWMARRHGVPVEEVELMPFGGVARMSRELVVEPRKESVVAVAGPVTNLALCGLALGCGHYGLWHEVYGPFFIQCNLLLVLFNMLPGLPLDGGHLYRAYLARRMNLPAATHRTAVCGQFWGVLIVTLGTGGLLLGLTGFDIIATGLFLYYAARREKQEAPYLYAQHLVTKNRDLERHGILPGEVLVARQDLPVWRVTQLFVPQRYHFVYTVDEHGRHTGVVDEAEIMKTLLEQGANVSLDRIRKGFRPYV
ncbi:MAG: M50 family metallopeptidase [Bacillota bacterium]